MAAGAAHIHGSLAHPQTDRALELALAEVEAGAAEWHRADRVVPERAQATWAKLGDRITRAIPLYAKRAPEVLDGWRVDGVELVLPSGSRLDLAGATVEGDTIADLKCKLTANDTMRGRLRWEFAVSPQLRHYVYEEDSGTFVLCGDNGKFMNHNDAPNCDDPEGAYTITNRHVRAGEELTCDYRSFDRESRLSGMEFHRADGSGNGVAHTM